MVPAASRAEPPPPPRQVLGAIFPPLTLSTRTDVWWTAPRAPLAVGFGASGGGGGRSAQAVGRWMAQGSFRDFSLDLMLHTPPAPHRDAPAEPFGPKLSTGTTAWAGLRIPIIDGDDETNSFGVYARGGVPVDDEARGRVDLGLAVGGAIISGVTWLFNFGSRQRIGPYVVTAPDIWNPYVLLGPTWQVTGELRLFTVGSFQGLLVGPYDDSGGAGGGSERAIIEWAAHVHPGAEVQVGPVLVSSSFAFGTERRPREPLVSAQIWLGVAP